MLFIKPREGKGFSIFVDIAKALPDKIFVVAGKTSRSARQALQPLANVSTIEWSNEMRQVYARTQALLGPSIAAEPFGRVLRDSVLAATGLDLHVGSQRN